jgi:hypothetical protein
MWLEAQNCGQSHETANSKNEELRGAAGRRDQTPSDNFRARLGECCGFRGAILVSSGDDNRRLGAIFRTLSEMQIATSNRQF